MERLITVSGSLPMLIVDALGGHWFRPGLLAEDRFEESGEIGRGLFSGFWVVFDGGPSFHAGVVGCCWSADGGFGEDAVFLHDDAFAGAERSDDGDGFSQAPVVERMVGIGVGEKVDVHTTGGHPIDIDYEAAADLLDIIAALIPPLRDSRRDVRAIIDAALGVESGRD